MSLKLGVVNDDSQVLSGQWRVTSVQPSSRDSCLGKSFLIGWPN